VPTPAHSPIGGATVALQAVTLAYMHVRFERLERLVGRVAGLVEEVLDRLSEVLDVQALTFAREAARGGEFLRRYRAGNDLALLEQARCAFVRGLADSRTWLSVFDGDRLLGEAARSSVVMRAAAACAVGEAACLVALAVPAAELAEALRAHAELWDDLAERLEAVPGPSRRIPSLGAWRTLPGDDPERRRRRWPVDCRALSAQLTADRLLVEHAGPAGLTALRKEMRAIGGSTDRVCIVVGGQTKAA